VSSIAKHIKKLRLQNKMTQEEMSGKLFVTRQTVSNWETGKSQPDIDTLMAIAETLHTDTTVLIYGSPPPSDRKKEIRRLIIACGLLLILVVILCLLAPAANSLYEKALFFQPLMLLRGLLLPVIWLVAGWTAVQGLRVPGLLKPVRHLSGKIIYIAALVIVLLYVVIMLPYWIETIKYIFLNLQFMQNPDPCSDRFNYEYNIPQFIVYYEYLLTDAVGQQPVVFAIPGLLLGLCQPERKRKKPLVSS
jgi:transcriptional regulator with XRE-family HTH domain